jgi:hypothetical protein
MGEVEFDRPTATRLEVYEQQPPARTEDVAWVRFAVEQLLDRSSVTDCSSAAPQRIDEKLAVRVDKLRSAIVAHHEPLGRSDSIREMRRRDIERPHAGMEALESLRVVGWRELSGWYGFVVSPERDHEAVTLVWAGLNSRIKNSHGALGFNEQLSKLDFELCDLLPYMCDSSEDVTRHETNSQLVRVVENDRLVDWQIKR